MKNKLLNGDCYKTISIFLNKVSRISVNFDIYFNILDNMINNQAYSVNCKKCTKLQLC